jgi:hypothetical protein
LQRIRHPLAGVNLIRLSEEREVNVRRLPAQGKTGKRGPISRVPSHSGGSIVSTTDAPDRFTTLPDDETLAETVVALEEHGFSVEETGEVRQLRLADTARNRRGAVLMVHGDPGIGKTALLEYADEAGHDFRVVQTAGVEGEMPLDLVERLPDPQRDALGLAFGLTGRRVSWDAPRCLAGRVGRPAQDRRCRPLPRQPGRALRDTGRPER